MSDQFRLRWPVDRHVINQGFGQNPDFYRPFGLPGHEGLDFYAPMNADIYAAADGQVYLISHPVDHPYGLHIRIRHDVGSQVYRTIYAHLAQVFVVDNQRVTAGERIARADNTGNSFGSHLHLTLKLDGAETAGYPAGIVDPWPFLKPTAEELPPASDLIVYSTDKLSLRTEPTVHSTRVTILPEGEPLTVLGDPITVRARIGKQGEWIRVRTESGLNGYVAAWFVRLTGETAPPSPLIVYPLYLLNLRARPTEGANRITVATPEDALTVLGDPRSAGAKIGEHGQWLNVQTSGGHVGYVAAWFVRAENMPPPPSAPPAAIPGLLVYPTANLNIRAQPATNSPRVDLVPLNQALTVLTDNPATARAKVGQEGQWLLVETEEGLRGWAAAWFLSLNPR